MVRAASAPIILAAWERAHGAGPVERALVLLSLARPHESFDQLTRCSIGERDAALLDLRVRLFGSDVQSLDSCPRCGEKVEITFGIDGIRVPAPPLPREVEIGVDGASLMIRPANSADLIAVEREPSVRLRREALARRCVCVRESTGDESAAGITTHWNDDSLRTVADKLAEIDPQADVRFALDCSRCGQAWSSRFDIASFLWAEIDAWAQRLLAEVHALAFAYGWAERDILAMTAWRRQLYMGMLRR